MIEAENNSDQELYDQIAKIREQQFTNLMRIQADLVYFGHFTLSDTERMKVIERRFHINEINRRIEEMSKRSR